MGFEPQPLRFERQGASAGERVVERGQGVAVEQIRGARVIGVFGAGPASTLPDLGPRLFQYLLVGGVLPEDQRSEDREQALAFDLRRHVTERPPVARFHSALLQRPLRGALLPTVRQ